MFQSGNQSPAFLQLLFSADLFGFLRELLSMIAQLGPMIRERRFQGIYEVLEQHRTITIHDVRGHVVTVDTTEKVRFRQNHVAAITDYVWGDGKFLAEYRCSPGVPVDCYKEGSRYAILISLREHKNPGDEVCLKTHRKIVGGFTRSAECWENDIYHRMGKSEIRVIFPRDRRCQRATVTRRNAGKTIALGPEHFQVLPDGRQQLSWAIKKPKLHERYALHWEW